MCKTSYHILILGAPGVGKGTYAGLLAKQTNAKIVDAGVLCRIAAQTDNNIRNIIKAGGLIDDEHIFKMVRDHLRKHDDNKQILIFDGFPRTVHQANLFHESELGDKYGLDLVLYLKLPHNILKSRLLGRRICSHKECQTGYNICDINDGDIVMHPIKPKKKEGFCDECGSPLVQRDDDNEIVIGKRLNIFYKLTHPLLQCFEKQGILILTHNIKKGVDDFPNILTKIQQCLSHDIRKSKL